MKKTETPKKEWYSVIEGKKRELLACLNGPVPAAVKNGGSVQQAIAVKEWAIRVRRELGRSDRYTEDKYHRLEALIAERASF